MNQGKGLECDYFKGTFILFKKYSSYILRNINLFGSAGLQNAGYFSCGMLNHSFPTRG